VEQIPSDAGFLQIVAVSDHALQEQMRLLLDAGEADVLTLAKEHNLPLLVDEKKGREQVIYRRGLDRYPGQRRGLRA
jgi:predicted nucleic acid-binding protein